MRRVLLIISAIFTSFLMISCATAIPKTNSEPLIEKIELIEEYKGLIDGEFNRSILDAESGGLIDLLIKIIQWLIDIVGKLINLVLETIQLTRLIAYLIVLIVTLYEFIMAIINFIIDRFTPDYI